MKKIPLTKGLFALVDDRDYKALRRFKWYPAYHGGATVYALRNIPGGKHATVSMHRQILRVPKGLQVDHRDGNGLNNQRNNLRAATRSQQVINRSLRLPNKRSRFRGVYWYPKNQTWRARITINQKQISLGLYQDEESAARAYNEAAKHLHGEFACINKV